MSEITKLNFVGNWRIIIQSRDAGWDQRVIVKNTAEGTKTLNGTVGNTIDVTGKDQEYWELHIQHNDGTHGWQNSWLRPGPKNIDGSKIIQVIESEDITTSSSDRDFNDLIIRLEKRGMIEQPSKPFAVWPVTMQMMPDGIFESSLGQYFMAVKVRNIWTKTWQVGSTVGLTQRCRNWLAAGGISVVDSWSSVDQATTGQEVVSGRILVGDLQPWHTKTIYFKVDVTNAKIRKHNIEVEILEPGAPDPNHPNRKAINQIFVSQTVYDASKKAFVSECDRGSMTVAIRELSVDYNTFKRAIGKAREIFKTDGEGGTRPPDTPMGRPGPGGRYCSRQHLEKLRQELLDFLNGKQVDICAIWRDLQCCCASGGFNGGGDGPGDDWTGKNPTGMEFFAFPTVLDYTIEYKPGFTGQFGPIPYDDPWWKILLIIIAIILSIAAAVSAAADLANRSDDVVIGQVTRSLLREVDNLVDAAVVTLNGNRGLRPGIFSYLDAASGEPNTNPLVSLNGVIDTPGTTLTNADITARIAAYALDPTDPGAREGVRVIKSGATTGLTFGLMTDVRDMSRNDHDDVTRTFINQVFIEEDPDNPMEVSDSGDSGSIWIQFERDAGGNPIFTIVALNHAGPIDPPNDHAWGSRIEDVMNELGIHFA